MRRNCLRGDILKNTHDSHGNFQAGGLRTPYWKLCYHFVWGTKDRSPIIEPGMYRAIATKAQTLGGFVHAIGGMEDRAHLAVSIPPKSAPAESISDVTRKTPLTNRI